MISRPLHVGLLTSARSWRGSTSVFATIGRGLAARGHDVVALVAHEEAGAGFRAGGVRAVRLPTGRTGLRGGRALRGALGELGTAVVLVDKPRDIRLAAFASLGRPLAVVYCISTPSPPRDPLTRLAFRRVRLTVFQTDQLAHQGLAAAPFMRRAPYRVIPNGVDCELFRPDRAAGAEFRWVHRVGDGPLLVGVGALAVEKRWDLLLESVALLARPAPPLVLCGSGPCEEALRAQAQRLELDVRFPGWLERAGLVGAYNAATCVVHAGSEVCSLALIEALACGRPIVASAGGGTPELLGDAGVLAPREDPRGFARLLEDLLGDGARREALGAAARRRAVERYSLERMVGAYVGMVESLA